MFFEEMMYSYWNKKAGKKKGFTLVEMLVVVAIIAVLVSVIIPVVGTHVTKAAAATNAANLRNAKGAFVSMYQMNPEEVDRYASGIMGMTGQVAEGELFVVNLEKDLKVEAPNAVAMDDMGTGVKEGEPMVVQISKDDVRTNFRVTYNGLPISYFAEVAENGTANPLDHQTEDDIYRDVVLDYQNDLTNRYNETIEAVRNNIGKIGSTVLDKINFPWGTGWIKDIAQGYLKNGDPETIEWMAFGSTLDTITNIVNNPETEGDCMQCALNRVDFNSKSSIKDMVFDSENFTGLGGNVIVSELSQPPFNYQYNASAVCAGFQKGADGKCSSCGHEAKMHFSAEASEGGAMDSIVSSTASQTCERGGVHNYDVEHNCTKCGKPHPTHPNGKHNIKTEGNLALAMAETCTICNTCMCCAENNYRTYQGTDTGVCMGGLLSDGCFHTKAQHEKAQS